ncbi:hypothetical protein Tco_1525839 [Tanacetum coccineum]
MVTLVAPDKSFISDGAIRLRRHEYVVRHQVPNQFGIPLVELRKTAVLRNDFRKYLELLDTSSSSFFSLSSTSFDPRGSLLSPVMQKLSCNAINIVPVRLSPCPCCVSDQSLKWNHLLSVVSDNSQCLGIICAVEARSAASTLHSFSRLLRGLVNNTVVMNSRSLMWAPMGGGASGLVGESMKGGGNGREWEVAAASALILIMTAR